MDSNQYLEQRVTPQIEWYDRKSSHNQRMFKTLRLAEIVIAALIVFAGAFTISCTKPSTIAAVAVGILSFLISIIAGTLSIGQHQKHWIEYRVICESLRSESFLFQAGVSPYDTKDAFSQLVHRIEGILTKENATWTQFMMKESKPEKVEQG